MELGKWLIIGFCGNKIMGAIFHYFWYKINHILYTKQHRENKEVFIKEKENEEVTLFYHE